MALTFPVSVALLEHVFDYFGTESAKFGQGEKNPMKELEIKEIDTCILKIQYI
jgi:hypothetical protein